MKNKLSCAFSGHREIETTEEIKNTLKLEVVKLIDSGVTVFLNGGALGFDILCAKTVIELKEVFKSIKLVMILPCKDQAKRWGYNNRIIYEDVLRKSDAVYYVNECYEPGCMQRRNRILVDRCDYLLAYLKKDKGGTYYTVKYAEKQGKNIIYLKD